MNRKQNQRIVTPERKSTETSLYIRAVLFLLLVVISSFIYKIQVAKVRDVSPQEKLNGAYSYAKIATFVQQYTQIYTVFLVILTVVAFRKEIKFLVKKLLK